MKCKNVVIHLGMHKTGSSSIRASLNKLTDPGFRYIAPCRSDVGRHLAAAFKDNPANYYYFKQLGLKADEIDIIRNEAIDCLNMEMTETAGKTAIISSESISVYGINEFRRLYDYFLGYAEKVTAVAYIRRPKEYMESIFQQQVKGGAGKKLAPHFLMPDYRARLELFDLVMGRENVKFWLFDPKSFPHGDVVQDFCARMGINMLAEDMVRVNEGISLPAMSLLFAYRKFGPEACPGPNFSMQNKLLINRVKKLKGPKFRLHSSVVEPVLASKRDGLSWMEDRLGASLAEDLAAHDKYAVRSEEDLLRFSPESLEWLARQLGPKYVNNWHPDMSPTKVARWMHLLHAKLSDANKN